MTTIVSIVEGDGEVAAFPVLLRRFCVELSANVTAEIQKPIRVRRDKFINDEQEFKRKLQLASNKCGDDGWIIVLLDADNDCPAELGAKLLGKIKNFLPSQRISVVIANKEYEAWFIAAASSLNGQRGFIFNETQPLNPEAIQGAKEWVSKCKSIGRYSPILDQPALSAMLDINLARTHSRSFQKLCSEWEKNILS